MISAGPARRHYNPELAPVLSLLRGLAGRDVPQQLVVEQPGWRLTLRRGIAAAPAAPVATATTAGTA
jgi:oxaloacetate decarboxylase alpha subunit